MKSCKPIPLLVLVLVLVGTSWAQKQPNQTVDPSANVGPIPNFVIDSATHDFGELKSGTPLRYAFKIKNTGKADLIIESVSPG